MLSKDRLAEVAAMSLEEFITEQERNNLADVPARTKLLILGGMADWKEVLPTWLNQYKSEYAKEG